ncbi:uncharacterized protein LOC143346596 [Colletes latitarsis]|uniref:uncharacterized protein LOC143346596 n=1 Tax=Colletes latitarsis TaxID=2605962 RepID=UPI0040373898
MNVSFILVLTVVFSGLLCCVPPIDAVPVPFPNPETHLSLEDSNGGLEDESLSKVWNDTLTLQSSLSTIMKIVMTKFCTIPESSDEPITCFGRSLLPLKHSLLRSILSFLNSSIDLLMDIYNENVDSTVSGRRRRMADNDTTMAVNSLVQLLTHPEGFSSQNLMAIVMDLIKWIWKCLSTQGLPQLHDTLEEVKNSGDITLKGQQLIGVYNIAYSLLEKFDLIGNQ